jgi:flagellar protein FlbD
MIHLTRLNSSPLTVNSDLIKFVEQSPDTVITLINGEKILVRESADEILRRIIEFRRSVLQGTPWSLGAPLAVPADSSEEEEPEPRPQR